jgi:hypothetical protein
VAYTYAGTLTVALTGTATASGDPVSGVHSLAESLTATFAASGGSAPTITGFLAGSITAAAGDLLLAHDTDPFQGMGSEGYSAGFSPASSKIKAIYIKNTDSTNTITIARKATNGLPIFDAASDAITLAAGDCFFYYKKAGTAALTTGSNDGLTISVGGGSPTADVVVIYGD